MIFSRKRLIVKSFYSSNRITTLNLHASEKLFQGVFRKNRRFQSFGKSGKGFRKNRL